MAKQEPKICIVSSCGGHLTEVRVFKPVYEQYPHFYVLNDRVLLPKDMEGNTYFIRHSERDWLFFVNLWEGDIGRPMTYEAVMSLVKRLCKKTGMSFTPHMLRHTRATLWIRGKQVSLEEVSSLLGHASIQTTHDTYVHLTASDLREALAKEGDIHAR